MRDEAGLTFVDVLMAILLIGIGLLSLVGTLDFSRSLTNQSEVKEAAAHRAQRELERVQRLDFAAIAHPNGTTFTASSSADNPTSRIVTGASPRFRYDRKASNTSEPFATAAAGAVELGPSSWSDGRFSGTVHRFVTAADDAVCKLAGGTASCPASGNYKRVTVVVTIRGLDDPLKPVWISSIITDPRDGPVNAEISPVTECLDSSGGVSECATSVNDTVKSLFLTDTPATQTVRQAITGSHPTHPTIGPVGICTLVTVIGCPKPDLLDDDPLPAPEVLPPLHKYSTDVSGGYTGGRALRRDASCAGNPSTTDNTKGGLWVAAAYSTATKLTGHGGLSLYTHALDGLDVAVTVCIAIYDVPGSIANLVSAPPTEIGRASFTLGHWPERADRVGFQFDFRTSDITIQPGHRIGIRIWVAASAGADIALIYDHPLFPSYVQLHEAED